LDIFGYNLGQSTKQCSPPLHYSSNFECYDYIVILMFGRDSNGAHTKVVRNKSYEQIL